MFSFLWNICYPWWINKCNSKGSNTLFFRYIIHRKTNYYSKICKDTDVIVQAIYNLVTCNICWSPEFVLLSKTFSYKRFSEKILFSMFSDEIQLNVSTQTNSNSFSFLLCFEVLSFLSRHAHAKWFVYAGM